MNSPNEIWRPVVGFEGLYEVSDHGRIRSIGRVVAMRDGRTKTVRSRILAVAVDDQGRVNVRLSRAGKYTNHRVHNLVATAFIGPRPPGLETCHNDGDPSRNVPSNLRYDTHSANMRDMARHGRNNVAKTHCPQGHPYGGANLRIIPSTGGRVCRICQARYAREQRERARTATA